jgi:hypothetical protein
LRAKHAQPEFAAEHAEHNRKRNIAKNSNPEFIAKCKAGKRAALAARQATKFAAIIAGPNGQFEAV